MVTFIPVAAVFAMSRSYSPSRRLVAAAIAGLMLATVVFTKSRGGVVGLVVMLAALVVLGQNVRRGFGAIAVAAVLLATPFMPASFWERMGSITNDQRDKQEFNGTRETRLDLMEGGIQTFLERPFTGVGAGQFQNYNPPWRKQQFNETHNALIQAAAETGILGLLAFSFLIARAGMGAAATMKMLRRPRKRRTSDPLQLVMTQHERHSMRVLTVGVTAGLCGWFVCALFASVAYNWTFYYLLALIVSGRELVRDRLSAGRTLQVHARKAVSVPAAALFIGSAAHGV
jgi:O-antigen ligase